MLGLVWSGSTRVGREIRVIVANQARSHASISTALISLVFADVGVAMEEARKAHPPGVLAKSLGLWCACRGLPTSRHAHGRHDAPSSVGGARRRIFMRFGRTLLCLCAWRRREIVDDVRHDELSQGVLGVCLFDTLWTRPRYQSCAAHVLFCRQLFSQKVLCRKCST